jgi:hypothetical protein
MAWLYHDKLPGHIISGVLVDLMLIGKTGQSAVDLLSEQTILRDVPVISWIGIDLGQRLIDRINTSETQVWMKPTIWLDWIDFASRFHNVVDTRSTASSS